MNDRINEKAIKKASVSELHGHTKITLTDVKTGEVEVIEKDNMVTDAVADIYEKNLFGQMDYKDVVPVRDMFGGVLCFSDSISLISKTPERTNRMTANAGQTSHSSTSTTRGNPNGGESQQLSNGYKFVWDFATNQGNGTINALSLCHKWAGDVGLSPIEAVTDEPLIKFSSNKMFAVKNGTNAGRAKHSATYTNLIYLSPDGSWGYHANGTTISKVKTYGFDQMINNSLGDAEVIESKTFTIGSFTPTRDSVTYDVENQKILFIVLGLDTEVTITSVDFDSEEEETITINAGITLDRTYTGRGSSSTAYLVLSNAESCNKWVKSGKYIFLPASDGNFYRINLETTSDITEITSHMGDVDYNFEMLGQVSINEGVVLGSNYIITNDGVYPVELPTYASLYSGTPPANVTDSLCIRVARSSSVDIANLVWIEFMGGGSTANTSTIYLGIAFLLPYLGTIQNLENPIVKTSDRTMKIEYTITNGTT